MNGSGTLDFDAVIKTTDFKRQMDEIERRIMQTNSRAAGEIDKVSASITNLGKVAGSYLAFDQLKGLAGRIIDVRGEFQQLSSAFNVMLGSKLKGDKLFQDAVDFAAKTPFTLQDVGKSAKQLLAYGTAAESVVTDLKTLGDVAAGVGAPIQDLVYLYGTLRTQGKALTVDIRQFAGRGIPIYAELAKVLGVATGEVSKMVEAGKVGFPQVEQAFKNMTKEGGQFNNMMSEQAKSLTGLASNLQDAFSRMFNDIGKSQEGLIAGTIKNVTELVNNYKEVEKAIALIVIAYGTYRAALLINTALTNLQSVSYVGLMGSINGATLAQIRLNLAAAINPYVALATVIVSLGAAMYIYGNHASTAENTQTRLNTAHQNATKAIDEQTKKLGVLSFEQQQLTKINSYALEIETELALLRASERNKSANNLLKTGGFGIGAENFNTSQLDAELQQRKSNVAALKRTLRKISLETEVKKTKTPGGNGGDTEGSGYIEKITDKELANLNAYAKWLAGIISMGRMTSKADDERVERIIAHLNLEQNTKAKMTTIEQSMAEVTAKNRKENHENTLKEIEEEARKKEESFRGYLQMASQLASVIGGSGFGDIFGGFAGILDAQKTGGNVGLATANFRLTAISQVVNAIRDTRAETEAYYASKIQAQRDYNIELNNQLILENRSALIGNIKGQYDGQFQKLDDAQKRYNEILTKITAPNSPLLAIGLDGKVGLLKNIKGLFKANGEVDLALLKAIGISETGTSAYTYGTSNIVKDLETWQKQIDDANAAIDDLTNSIAGNLGDSLRNSLITAFKEGGDAAAAFGKDVSDVLEQISTQILFQAVFKSSFDALSDDIKKSFGIDGDGTLTDDFGAFLAKSPELIGQYNAGLAALQAQGAANGLNILGGGTGTSTDQLSGSIKGVSEQTASVVAGQMNAMRITQALMNRTLTSGLEYWKQTAENTKAIKDLMGSGSGFRANGL